MNEDAKKRFSINDDIPGRHNTRANQGHSIKTIQLDKLCGVKIMRVDDRFSVVHGSFKHCSQSIYKNGLMVGGLKGQSSRQAIHCVERDVQTQDNPKDAKMTVLRLGRQAVSGIRTNSETLVFLDINQAIKDGIPFYRSLNNVIVSQGIDELLMPSIFKEFMTLKMAS